MWLFNKSLTGCTDCGGYENRNEHFYNNKIKENEELTLVILNCTLLHDKNDGWAVHNPN